MTFHKFTLEFLASLEIFKLEDSVELLFGYKE